jgi:hypothetical protein
MADNASQFNLGLTAVDRSTHLLDSVSGLQVYGIEEYGTVCFFLYNGLPGAHLWASGQTCGGLSSPGSAVWQQVPGTCQQNPFVVGVVPDQARTVTVSIGSQTTTVRPVHNIFVVPYKSPHCSPTGEKQVQQDILPATVYVDGRVSPSTGSWPSP